MDISKIITIPGKSGLFKVIAQSKNGVIVESIVDNKRFPVPASSRFSSLEEIYIFTTEEEALLKDIFKTIFNKEVGKAITVTMTDEQAVKKYFVEILPNYDTERVYISDIKKVYNWYNLLLEKGIITAESIAEEDNAEAHEEGGEKKEAKKTSKNETKSQLQNSMKGADKIKTGSASRAPKKTTTTRKVGS